MSINTINRRSTTPVWTWRVTTTAGVILIPAATVGEAVRRAGMAGTESVQPATETRTPGGVPERALGPNAERLALSWRVQSRS
jgi:hypothetical protein